MENCLVTKLKKVVNNDNLIPLGFMRGTFTAGGNKKIRLLNGKKGYIHDNGTVTEITGDGGTVYGFTPEAAGYIDFEYGVNYLEGFGNLSADSLSFTVVQTLYGVVVGDIEKLPDTFYNLYIDESDKLTGNPNLLKSILIENYSIAKCSNVGQFDINLFGASQVSKGRVSGVCNVNASKTYQLTYTIKFGSSMVNPTAEETAQGYQVA